MTNREKMQKAIQKAKAHTPKPPNKKQRKAAQQKERRSADGRDRRMVERGRLPDGARFDVKYDATSQTWFGTLRIPGQTILSEANYFGGQAKGVFRLLEDLDTQYRNHLKAKGETK